eukprot:6189785-Pleurochrysis_carterae.AAC.2
MLTARHLISKKPWFARTTFYAFCVFDSLTQIARLHGKHSSSRSSHPTSTLLNMGTFVCDLFHVARVKPEIIKAIKITEINDRQRQETGCSSLWDEFRT